MRRFRSWLTHWGRVTHICVSKLTIIGSDNGLSPDRRQALIWTNAGILLIGPLGTNFSEILIEILTFSFKKMRLKVSSAKRRPFCLGLNVLNLCISDGVSYYFLCCDHPSLLICCLSIPFMTNFFYWWIKQWENSTANYPPNLSTNSIHKKNRYLFWNE